MKGLPDTNKANVFNVSMKVVLSRRKLLNLNVIEEKSLTIILVWFDGKNEKK